MINRRDLIKAGGSAIAIGAMGFTARSYSRIAGANDRINVGVMGANSRGKGLLFDFLEVGNVDVTHVCDVDSRVLAMIGSEMNKRNQPKPTMGDDIRRQLEDKEMDVLVVAAPDHWHAPATVMALQAGKHVYVEKPCGHNPREGELLVAAQQKYNKVVQMGNQQRSSPQTIELIEAIGEGELGDVYYIYTWYANARPSIGRGKSMVAPDWLNWDLWQGPAPRAQYMDNFVHYNWHWFWHWGTGETCNNGAHELDIARWAMGVDYPERVTVNASRKFYRDDDWQMYDTMLAKFAYSNDRLIEWEGNSCNNVKKYGRGRGTLIYGTRGHAIVDREGYEIYDINGNLVRESKSQQQGNNTFDLVGEGVLNGLHISNFLSVVRGEPVAQNSPIVEGHKSTLMCHLANIAYRTGEPLQCDSTSGKPHSPAALALWGREYEKGWEINV